MANQYDDNQCIVNQFTDSDSDCGVVHDIRPGGVDGSAGDGIYGGVDGTEPVALDRIEWMRNLPCGKFDMKGLRTILNKIFVELDAMCGTLNSTVRAQTQVIHQLAYSEVTTLPTSTLYSQFLAQTPTHNEICTNSLDVVADVFVLGGIRINRGLLGEFNGNIQATVNGNWVAIGMASTNQSIEPQTGMSSRMVQIPGSVQPGASVNLQFRIGGTVSFDSQIGGEFIEQAVTHNYSVIFIGRTV